MSFFDTMMGYYQSRDDLTFKKTDGISCMEIFGGSYRQIWHKYSFPDLNNIRSVALVLLQNQQSFATNLAVTCIQSHALCNVLTSNIGRSVWGFCDKLSSLKHLVPCFYTICLLKTVGRSVLGFCYKLSSHKHLVPCF